MHFVTVPYVIALGLAMLPFMPKLFRSIKADYNTPPPRDAGFKYSD